MILCPHCQTEISDTGLELFAQIICPTCSQKFRVNTQLGVYKITELIGIGGMSLVYRAKDTVLGREVALKVLNSEYRNDPNRTNRFEKECALMAKVRHSHVARVYTAGRDEGYGYIAMELINGSNVESDIAETGAFPPEEALRLIRQVAEGLQAAHKAGLLHRDMKPANILLNQARDAKVVDFGLSLLRSESDSEDQIWATPYYVSPETLRRESEDERSDIYALGMTLRHMLMGIPPFSREITSIRSLLTLKKALKPLHSVMPSLPVALCELTDRMTSFSKRNRPASYEILLIEAEETRIAMEKELADGVPHFTPRQKTRKLFRKWKIPALLLFGGLAVYLSVSKSPPPSRSVPVAIREDHLSSNSSDGDIVLHQAETALSVADFKKAANKFSKLAEISMGAIRTWGALQAYNCFLLSHCPSEAQMLIRWETASFRLSRKTDSLGTKTILTIDSFFKQLANYKQGKLTIPSTENEELTASLELAAALFLRQQGHLKEAQPHFQRATQLFRKLSGSAYVGYLSAMHPVLINLTHKKPVPPKKKQASLTKNPTISPLNSAISRGLYAKAKNLATNEGQTTLAEMCSVADRFCTIIEQALTPQLTISLPASLDTISGQTIPSKKIKIEAGHLSLGEIPLRVTLLTPRSLVALYQALSPEHTRQAREMQAVLLFLNGKTDEANSLAKALILEDSENTSPFNLLWQQWQESMKKESQESRQP